MFAIHKKNLRRSICVMVILGTGWNCCVAAEADTQSRIAELQKQNEADEELVQLLLAKQRIRQREQEIGDLQSGQATGSKPVKSLVEPPKSAPTLALGAKEKCGASTCSEGGAKSTLITSAASYDDEVKEPAPVPKEKKTGAEEDSSNWKSTDDGKEIYGIKLGAGLSFTVDIGEHDRVTKASIVDGLVRIDDADNTRSRIMFESHYFFEPKGSFLGLLDCDKWGWGPFVAIQPGSDEIIEAIAFGGMVGFKKEGFKSFNIGLGFVFDPNTQILGEGIWPNQPLPGGETEIRYKQDSQTGVMGIISFTF